MGVTRMRAEIGEQPAALRRTLDVLLPRVGEVAAVCRDTRQVLFVARGSSDNAAVYGRYLAEVRCGRLGSLASPSVATLYAARVDLDGVLAVGLSQSGETQEIVETLEWAGRCGARTLAVTNRARSGLAEVAEVALVTEAGDELAVPATKTYTTQLAALAVLALGMCDRDEMEPLAAELGRVPDEVERMLGAAASAEELAGELTAATGAVVSGRGFTFSTALELALKLKEACYLHATGLSYADLLHGPIAVVDADTPAVLVAPSTGPTLPGMVALAERVAASGAGVYGIGGDSRLAAACRHVLPGPDLPDWLTPLALAVPGQLLTEALARRLGIDPDAPRGLGKVTQTESPPRTTAQ